MILPPGTKIITSLYREQDYYYNIDPGWTYIFEFNIKELSRTLIDIGHFFENSQDYSISCWFSRKPLDDVMFMDKDDMSIFSIARNQLRKFSFSDIIVCEENEVCLNSSFTYYLNIKNLQNKLNQFYLKIDDRID